MHGCDSEPVLIVNAEFDSMGGVVEGGVDIANKTSPRKAAIEKVQVELRREYDNRDKTKRQLEFLEKGGDLLDYMIGNAASISVHSTSFTGQHPDQFVTSEAKGSVAFTASPHGDSVESSGRPGRPSCEPNSADNLMLLDAENGSSEGDRTLFHRSSGQAMPSEHSCQVDGTHKNREHGDCAPLVLPGKAYKRRNRSRPNRDGARSSSSDVNPTHGSHGCSLPSHSAARDVKGLLSDAEKRNTSLNWNSQPTTPIESTIHSKTTSEGGKNDTELDRSNSAALTEDLVKCVPADAESDSIASKNHLDEQLDGHSLSGVPKAPTQMDSNGLEAVKGQEEMASVVIECHPSPAATIVENQFRSSQINGFSGKKGDEVTNDSNNSSALCGVKYLGSESCKPTNPSNGIETYTRIRIVSSNGNAKDQSLVPDATPVTESDKIIKQKDTEGINSSTRVNEASPKQELNQNISALKNEVKNQLMIDRMEVCWPTGAESGRRPPEPLCVSHGPQNETSHDIKHPDSIDIPILDLPKTGSLTRVCNVSLEAQTLSEPDLKSEKRIDEDSVLKEAEIIKAKRRRIAELSIVTAPPEFREKSHWDYVLEEIAWLANDFAQERIWKLASAAQISSRVAFACRLRKQEKSLGMTAKKVSHTLARAVMEFWHCVEIQIQESSKELEQEQQNPKDGTLSVQAYAVRFLRHNKSNIFQNQTEVPLTPEKESDSGIPDISWEDSFTEENLFYEVPHGAMDSYRKLIESHVAQCEKIGGHMQEELETSACDTAAGFGYQHIVYDEDEGETSTYNMSVALEGSKPSRFGQKKQKYLTNDYGSRSYEMGAGLLPMRCVENKDVTEQSTLLGKRPGSSLKLSIPTKRIRTASRRVTSTFSAGASEGNQVPNKTEASSGDTNSFQDVQSTLRGGLLVPSSLEYESVGDFEKQLLYDSAEVSTKPKKRKKAKHLNAAYEHRWQVDSGNQNGQRDYLKKTSESYQFESNGNSGSLGQPIIKKPKIMRPSQDNSFDNIPPSGGSVPSPVASQMSNMSNPNKIIKMLGGRDRGRKAKALKMPPGQLGSGNPWSLFEDQALVVLVHDMGPNWELVSDAINSTMHFKCIFRKAKECKERHNILMDRTSGDGADSAEDSGSSQPYPSTLPGIPKGSARQLFQRLQGPMEEDILKSHFEKIIMIGQKQHYRKPQNDQDLKQRQQPHGSHAIALSQVSPNNLNGGHILTPLDLCDLDTAITDMFSLGYQGPHSSGSGITNQGTVTPMPSASGASSPLQGSTNMMMGSNFSSSGGPLNSFRDGRYMVPRSAPLSTDDQQRLQQLIPGRSIQQANISASGALRGTDRGGRIVPGGGGMGMVGGVNRSLPMARPGSQGFASSSTANSGSVVSPGMPSANMHSGVGAGQGSTMLRPRDGHMMRPDFQIPGNSQGVSHFGGLSSPPVSSYPLHHQPSHPISTQPAQALSPRHPHFQRQANLAPPIAQQQAYAVRLAKDRQQQHRLLQQQQQQQQQQQFPASSSLMPHVQQSQPQHPISSPVQNSSQVLSHSTAPPMNSMPQHQQKQQAPTQGVGRNAQSGGNVLSNQTGKQRPKPHQFANRQHPLQQRQQLQSQQQAKVAKVVGRGNTTMNQCVPIDSTLLNGVSANPGLVKGESTPHIMPNQGSYAAAQPTRQSSSQTLPQQKMYSAQASLSSKHIQVTSNSDNSSQVHVPLAGNQPVSSSAVAGPNHQQASPHQKIVNQNQPALRRAVQPNRLIISDASTKPQGRNPNADEHPTSSSTEKDKTQTLPEAGSNATNVAPVVSPVNVHQWTASEPLLDSNALDSAQPNSSESLPQAGQGPGQRPSTASLPASRHDVSAQWQQKQNQQVQQPQQQAQLLQAGNDDSFDKSSDNRLE